MRERLGTGDKGEMVEIKYCVRCGWLPRSAWMAQELLGTFGEALGGGVACSLKRRDLRGARGRGASVVAKGDGKVPRDKGTEARGAGRRVSGHGPGSHGFALSSGRIPCGIVFDNCAGCV